MTIADLIAPHGGLSEPVSCTVPKEQIEQFKAEANSLLSVPLSTADLSFVYRFADGTLSPLIGPMNREVYLRVLEECVIGYPACGHKVIETTCVASLDEDSCVASAGEPVPTGIPQENSMRRPEPLSMLR